MSTRLLPIASMLLLPLLVTTPAAAHDITAVPAADNSYLKIWHPVLSSDGRYLAYLYGLHVYRYDSETGEHKLLSSSRMFDANEASNPAISADGKHVCFTSRATDLVAGDTNGLDDVFVRDVETDFIERVNVGPGGVQADGGSYALGCAISGDGRYVAFASAATNIVPGAPGPGVPLVYLRDRQTGETRLLSKTTAGQPAYLGGYSEWPSITPDGRYVAFASYASNIITNDSNQRGDIFVYDRITDTTERVSVASNGAEGDAHSTYPAISADGRYVAFRSDATNLVPSDTNGVEDIFVYDRTERTIERASLSSSGEQQDKPNWYNPQSRINIIAAPAISGDGRYVIFASSATNLVEGDTNGFRDVFLYDRTNGITRRVSVSWNGEQANEECYYGLVSISADGTRLAFDCRATNIAPGVRIAFDHIYLSPVIDECPSDPLKSQPGLCGCGAADTDSDADGIPDCREAAPTTPPSIRKASFNKKRRFSLKADGLLQDAAACTTKIFVAKGAKGTPFTVGAYTATAAARTFATAKAIKINSKKLKSFQVWIEKECTDYQSSVSARRSVRTSGTGTVRTIEQLASQLTAQLH